MQSETIQWAKKTNQDLILLKLDFKKAYNTVTLPFLFKVMAQIGIPIEFIQIRFYSRMPFVWFALAGLKQGSFQFKGSLLGVSINPLNYFPLMVKP